MVRSIVSVSLASQKRIFPSLSGVPLNNSDRGSHREDHLDQIAKALAG